MSELLTLLLQASLWLALAALLLAGLRPLLLRLGGAALAYRSWWLLPVLLVALCLPLPPLPIGDVAPVAAIAAALRAPSVSPTTASWPAWALALWLLGAVAMAVRAWHAQRRFERALGTLRRRSDGNWQASADPGLPALVGLWRPRIVVGPGFEHDFSAAEQDLILQHERNHRRHGDPWANATLGALRCVFWFHPLLPWAARRFLRDQELACDARTLDPHPALRRLYANALLKAQLVHPVAPMACHWRSQPMLKERIAMLKEHKPKALPWLTGQVLLVGVCVGVGSVAWASQSGAATVPALTTERFEQVQTDTISTPGERPVVPNKMNPPSYPTQAFEQGQSGQVVLRVDVDARGVVSDVQVLSASNPGFFEASAISAARTWTYAPALRNGMPVAAAVRIPVTFEMDATAPTP